MRHGPDPPPLVTRRLIAAPPARVFAAWIEPEQLRLWWGPAPVICVGAEVDARVGGRYRIANRFPDGAVLWISGTFERVDPPRLLAYSWRVEPGPRRDERVTVRFEPRGAGTEVIVIHDRIADAALRERHAVGWDGCLVKLEAVFATAD